MKIFDASSSRREAIHRMHAQLPPVQLITLRESLQRVATCKTRAPCALLDGGTGFTGTDVAHVWLSSVCMYWGAEFQVSLQPTMRFGCDSGSVQQSFLRRENPDLPLLFRDMSELHLRRAFDLISESYQSIPPVGIFLAGWVCRDWSTLSSNRTHSAGCAETGDGQTGMTWTYLQQYIGTHKPPILVMENVPNIERTSSDSSRLSDIDYVLKTVSDSGYSVRRQLIDAANHGSVQRRKRIYIVGIRGAIVVILWGSLQSLPLSHNSLPPSPLPLYHPTHLPPNPTYPLPPTLY